MSNGRFRRYYWQIHTLLSENTHLLDVDHSTCEICKDYEVEYAGTFWADIVFKNGYRLNRDGDRRLNCDRRLNRTVIHLIALAGQRQVEDQPAGQ